MPAFFDVVLVSNRSADVLPDFLIVRKPSGLEFGKDQFAADRYFEPASIRRDENEAFDLAFEFRYEFIGQTDRLRLVVSSLAINNFDFHTLIFSHPTAEQKEFFGGGWNARLSLALIDHLNA